MPTATTEPATAMVDAKLTEFGACALCDEPYDHYGNNPAPLGDVEQRVCDRCNAVFVIPARIGHFSGAQVRAIARLLASR